MRVETYPVRFKHGFWYRRGAYLIAHVAQNCLGLPEWLEYDWADSSLSLITQEFVGLYPAVVEIKIKVKGWTDNIILEKQ